MCMSGEIWIFHSFSLGSHKVNEWSQLCLSFAFLPEDLCLEKGIILQGCFTLFHLLSVLQPAPTFLLSSFGRMETEAVSWNSSGPCQIRIGPTTPCLSHGKWKKSHKYLQDKAWTKTTYRHKKGNEQWCHYSTSKCLKERVEDSSLKVWLAL